MGIVMIVLEKYYPHLVKYEFFIKMCIDLVFILVFILFTVSVVPAYYEVCPNQTSQAMYNYSTILSQLNSTP